MMGNPIVKSRDVCSFWTGGQMDRGQMDGCPGRGNLVLWQGTWAQVQTSRPDRRTWPGPRIPRSKSDQLVRLTWHHFKCKARTACVFPTVRRSYFWGLQLQLQLQINLQLKSKLLVHLSSLIVGEYEFIIIRNRKNNWFFWRSTFLAFINIKSSNIWQFYVHFDAVNVLATKDMIFKLLMIIYWPKYRTKKKRSPPI